VKSNNEHTDPNRARSPEYNIQNSLQKEKETLVTMFLLNASHMELSEQFRRIDELNKRLTDNTSH
jgi:hypothetical protein